MDARGVQMARPPGQPTRSDNFDNQMWVPTLVGQLRVSCFKTHETQPAHKLQCFWRFSKNFRPNSARSHQDLVRILQDPTRSCRYPMKSRLDLDRSGKISASVIKPETNSIQPKTDKTRAGRFDQIIQVGFKLYFYPTKVFESSMGWAKTQPHPSCGQS